MAEDFKIHKLMMLHLQCITPCGEYKEPLLTPPTSIWRSDEVGPLAELEKIEGAWVEEMKVHPIR